MGGWAGGRAGDTATGGETALLAWRRTNVTELNSRVRAWMAAAGRLTGPELAADGVCYRAGNRSLRSPPTVTPGWSSPSGPPSPTSMSTPPPCCYAPTTTHEAPGL